MTDILTHDTERILFLKGVFKKSCKFIEDIFQDQLKSNFVTQKKDDTIVYDKVPIVFEGMHKWVHSTNQLCHHCSLPFKGCPKFIPRSIENRSCIYREPYIYCSFNCAQSDINTMYSHISEHTNKTNMLKYLYRAMVGDNINEIVPALPKSEMIYYGGKLTAEEYKKKNESLNRTIKVEL